MLQQSFSRRMMTTGFFFFLHFSALPIYTALISPPLRSLFPPPMMVQRWNRKAIHYSTSCTQHCRGQQKREYEGGRTSCVLGGCGNNIIIQTHLEFDATHLKIVKTEAIKDQKSCVMLNSWWCVLQITAMHE